MKSADGSTMTIDITLEQIIDNADWDKFCELKGYNPWCINEGIATGSKVVTLTLEEAEEIDLL